jgi:hypothetical protein
MPTDDQGCFRPGLATTAWLAGIGITHIRQVAVIGVIETCHRLRAVGHPVSLNLAYGLQADLMGTTWNQLPEEERAALRSAFNAGPGSRPTAQRRPRPAAGS